LSGNCQLKFGNAEFLFQIIAERDENAAVILTTNLLLRVDPSDPNARLCNGVDRCAADCLSLSRASWKVAIGATIAAPIVAATSVTPPWRIAACAPS
jgi:hypothetical protein